MDTVYLLSLVPILLTEYGFQSSISAIRKMKKPIAWKRTVFRLLFWFSIVLRTLCKQEFHLIVPVISLFLIGESCCFYLRYSIRKDLKAGLTYGSIKSHALTFILPAGLIAIAYALLSLYLRRIGLSDELGKLLLVEFLGPSIILDTKMIFLAVVLNGEWTWASLAIRSIERQVQGSEEDNILNPKRFRKESLGILERFVTLALVALGGYAGAATVIAIKSTSRLPKLAQWQDAEQFIIETLGSVGLATLGGLLICV
jgi:hypothetical protein